MTDKPQLPPSRDGIYPRCVWCNGENYLPAVFAYSAGTIPCAAAGGCGKRLPADPEYIPFNQEIEYEMDSLENEIAAIVDDRIREMHIDAFNKRYGPYLMARLNDERNP